MEDNIKRIHREYVCKLCNNIIGDTGMCDYQCEQDFLLVRARAPGTVIERVYDMILTEQREI